MLSFPRCRELASDAGSRATHRLAGFAVLLLTLVLAGCYETEEPLLSKGEYIPLSGPMSCQSKIDGRKFTTDLKETKSGFPLFYSYTYREGDSTLTFKGLKDQFFLAQIKADKERVYKYIFLKFYPNSVTLYVPNTMQNGAAIDNLVREAGITVNASNPEHIRLMGDTGKRLDFLSKHDLNVMALFAECSKS